MIYCADSLKADLPVVDCVITDPPYSEKTHSGHDAATGKTDHGHLGAGFDDASRRGIDYSFWTHGHLWEAVTLWNHVCAGWIVIITDHVLAPEWTRLLRSVDRYVFAPLPFVSPGSRVRLTGDGPSSWTCWIVAARPKHRPYSNWGTLPGAYIFKPERMPIIGGKPLSLMRALVRDYSREGDLVCDPCCGAGTTLVAAKELGRRWLGYDTNADYVALARKRVEEANQTGFSFNRERDPIEQKEFDL